MAAATVCMSWLYTGEGFIVALVTGGPDRATTFLPTDLRKRLEDLR